MPHKGRPYPYHPAYWSAPAWFYRGFVPWKLVAEQLDSIPPWFGCVFGSTQPVSLPGEPSDDYLYIDYTFNVVTDCLVSKFEVRMERVGVLDAFQAHWQLTTHYWDGTSEVGHGYQVYPQREVSSPHFILTAPNPDTGPPIVMFAHFYPANYEEGGSPYLRVPPAPPW